MKFVQDKYTRTKKNVVKNDEKTHPFTRRDKFYKQLQKIKNIAKKAHMENPTEITKQNLRLAHINAYKQYNLLKSKYYNSILQNTSGNSKQLYDVLRSKRRPANSLPTYLVRDGTKAFGNKRNELLGDQLKSSFPTDGYKFSNNHTELYQQLERVYDEFFKDSYTHLWKDFLPEFTIEEVESAILSLNPNKDPGPMGISTSYIQFNLGKFLSPIHNILTNMLEYGIIPHDWKKSYIVPIPKKGDKFSVTNYRGIAIQSVLPKLFDKLITNKIRSHLNTVIPES